MTEAEDWPDRTEALRNHPLPEGVQDTLLNRMQLAKAMNVSENTISKWRQSGMPCVTEGTTGREWEFQLSECYAWRMFREEEQRKRREAGDQAAAQMALEFLNNPEDESAGRLSPREIIEQSEAEIRRMKAAQQRGDLLPVDRVRESIERAFVNFRNSAVSLPDFAEIEFGLAPEDVEKFVRRVEGMLEDIERQVRELLKPEGELHQMKASEDRDA